MRKFNKILVYFIIPLVLLLILIQIRQFSCKDYIAYGKGHASMGAFYLLLYGVYLTVIVLYNFYNLYRSWMSKEEWKTKMILYYTLILSYSFSLSILHTAGIRGYSYFTGKPFNYLIYRVCEWFFFVGLSMAFPIGILNLLVAIISFFYVRKFKQKYTFSILVLIISLVISYCSFISFGFVSSFWFEGGINC